MFRAYRAAFLVAIVAALVADRPALGGQLAADLAYGTHPDQLFDWYGPDVPVSGPTPIAVFLHGAQGTVGNKTDVNLGSSSVIKNHLLRNGFSVMAISYRPYPQFIYPTQIEDAALAIQHFKSNASTFQIDPARLIVWGLSGGAIIGGKLAYGIDYANPNGTPTEQISTRPIAFLNHIGLSNFTLMVPWWPGSFFGQAHLYQVDPLLLDEASFSENVLDIVRPFTPPAASLYGMNENPPPVSDPHDVTMMKNFHANLLAGFPAVAAKSITLQTETGSAKDDLEYVSEWAMHRVGIASALNLGKGKAGSLGVEPKLEIASEFGPGSPFSLNCHASVAAPVTLLVIFSEAKADLALAGGTLVPSISGIATLAADSNGVVTIGGTLPAGLPLGVVTYLQFVHADPGATFGVAFSNAVRVTTGI